MSCEKCEALQVEISQLRAQLAEANEALRIAYTEMVRMQNDGYFVSRPRFNQLAVALKKAEQR